MKRKTSNSTQELAPCFCIVQKTALIDTCPSWFSLIDRVMKILLNNQEQIVDSNSSIYSVLLSEKIVDKGGIAVALNNEVIPKQKWESTKLNDNDKLVIITATAGG